MTDADIGIVESELCITVPSFLKRWFLQNPFRNFPHPTRCLVCNRDRLIHENIVLRRQGYYGREWPDQMLWIGDDWSGGAYFVDASENSPGIFWYDWEEGKGEMVLPAYSERHSPDEFIDYISRLSQ